MRLQSLHAAPQTKNSVEVASLYLSIHAHDHEHKKRSANALVQLTALVMPENRLEHYGRVRCCCCKQKRGKLKSKIMQKRMRLACTDSHISLDLYYSTAPHLIHLLFPLSRTCINPCSGRRRLCRCCCCCYCLIVTLMIARWLSQRKGSTDVCIAFTASSWMPHYQCRDRRTLRNVVNSVEGKLGIGSTSTSETEAKREWSRCVGAHNWET